jgi:hypothetical protein
MSKKKNKKIKEDISFDDVNIDNVDNISVSKSEDVKEDKIEENEPIKEDVANTTNDVKEVKKPVNKTVSMEYIDNYVKYVKENNFDNAILSLSNSINTIINNDDVKGLKYLINVFKDNKNVLSEKIALRKIQLLDPVNVMRIQCMYTILKSATNNKKVEIDMKKLRSYTNIKDNVYKYLIKVQKAK